MSRISSSEKERPRAMRGYLFWTASEQQRRDNCGEQLGENLRRILPYGHADLQRRCVDVHRRILCVGRPTHFNTGERPLEHYRCRENSFVPLLRRCGLVGE